MSRTLVGEKPNVADQRTLVLVLSHNPRALVARAQSYLILHNLFKYTNYNCRKISRLSLPTVVSLRKKAQLTKGVTPAKKYMQNATRAKIQGSG